MQLTSAIARAILPQSARRYVREMQHRAGFDAAMRRLLDLQPGADWPPDLAQALQHGWANEDMSASTEYLHAAWRHAALTPGPVLECGSGLSTLVLGAAKRGSRHGVWALEHDRLWVRSTRTALARFGLTNVVVCHAPLRNYGSFAWYDPNCALAGDFSLVLCDGPPGTTRGGRYGLLPRLGAHLRPGCIVLLDDAARPGEQAVLQRWKEEARVTHVLRGTEKPFAEIALPEHAVRATRAMGVPARSMAG